MLKVSNSLSDIAVLRGGKKDFKVSLKEGAEILQSLTKIDYKPLDVLIDIDGNWTLHGQPTDAHYIFTIAHTVVDTTHMMGEEYQDLARRMNVPILFSHDDRVCMDREDMYRILRQQGFKVPETSVIRAKVPVQSKQLHSIWGKYHTPLLLRPLVKKEGLSSKLITSFNDLENIVKDYHSKGVDTHILTYRKVPTSSVAVIPNFRGENLYTPLWVETLAGNKDIPGSSSSIRAHTHISDIKKEQMKELVRKVYEALDLSGPVCIDVIPSNDNYIVVNIDTTPSLRSGGRFMQSLQTTGVDVGQYIHSHIKNSL